MVKVTIGYKRPQLEYREKAFVQKKKKGKKTPKVHTQKLTARNVTMC